MRYPMIGPNHFTLLSYLIFAERWHGTTGQSTSVDHDAINRLEGVPALGRGYSVTTNSLLSSCLDVNDTTTERSYNYESFYTAFTNDEQEFGPLFQGGMKNTFGYQRVKETISETININKNSPTDDNGVPIKRRYTVALTMRLDRSFTTLLENTAILSPAAASMIKSEKYVSFFMTCGPKYVRSLQRAQEVTAIFNFDSSDNREANLFAESIRLHAHGNRGRDNAAILSQSFESEENEEGRIPFRVDQQFDDTDIMRSLSIELVGYGLGLNNLGLKTLVTTSLDEFNAVMRFSFDSMIKNDTDSQSGIISEMEVVPWSDNAEFLMLAQVGENHIVVDKPRALVEESRAITSTDGVQTDVCLSGASIIDDYGLCCDENELKILTILGESKRSCKSFHYLSTAVMKSNLELNSEFVAWLSSVGKEKALQLSTLGQCVNKIRSFPKRFDYFYLEPNTEAEYDDDIEMKITLKELRAALDPAGSLDIISMIGRENDEYFEMFYQPCISALYGINIGQNNDAEPKHFMAEQWYNHEECSRYSCMDPSMAWDRTSGKGCVDGLLTRKSVEDPIPAEDDPHCATLIDEESGLQTCKYKYSGTNNLVTQIDSCREQLPKSTDGRGQSVPLPISALMDYYCMPKLAIDMEQADSEKMDEVDALWDTCVEIQ